MDERTARKISRAQKHAQAALAAATDVPDWLEHTAPSFWDLDVLAAHAKTLEVAGCHLRRLIADAEIVRLAA